jgi:hypothetical protein
MIGEWVEHPQYGRGQVVALFRNGTEWMVRFDSGLRFRRPRQEFNGQREGAMNAAPPALPTAPPMPRTQMEARQLIEALRVGSNVEPLGSEFDLISMPLYLNSRATTIYAGSNEVQRDLIARSLAAGA